MIVVIKNTCLLLVLSISAVLSGSEVSAKKRSLRSDPSDKYEVGHLYTVVRMYGPIQSIEPKRSTSVEKENIDHDLYMQAVVRTQHQVLKLREELIKNQSSNSDVIVGEYGKKREQQAKL